MSAVTAPPERRAPNREPRWSPARLAIVAMLGLVAAFGGTAVHRMGGSLAWGVLLSVLTLVACSTLMRAAAGRAGVLTFAIAASLTVVVLAYAGPGGDVLVANDAPSMVWLILAPVSSFAGTLMPRSWFSDEAVGGR